MEGVFNEKEEFCDCTVHMWEDVPGGVNHLTASVLNSRCSMPPAFVLECPRGQSHRRGAGHPRRVRGQPLARLPARPLPALAGPSRPQPERGLRPDRGLEGRLTGVCGGERPGHPLTPVSLPPFFLPSPRARRIHLARPLFVLCRPVLPPLLPHPLSAPGESACAPASALAAPRAGDGEAAIQARPFPPPRDRSGPGRLPVQRPLGPGRFPRPGPPVSPKISPLSAFWAISPVFPGNRPKFIRISTFHF